MELVNADKTTDDKVRIDLEDIPLKTTLDLLLRQLYLYYRIQDGLMIISSRISYDYVTPLSIMEEKADRGELNRQQYKQLIEAMKLADTLRRHDDRPGHSGRGCQAEWLSGRPAPAGPMRPGRLGGMMGAIGASSPVTPRNNRVAPALRLAYNRTDEPGGSEGWGTRDGEAGALVADLSASKPRRLIVLGSGTSTGVPVIGCECPVCRSDDPRNSRTRCSVLVKLPAGNLLIDTSPEMRLQLVRERVGMVHAIAYTHHHVDHLFGLDDARMFPQKLGGPVPIYCELEVEEVIRRVFHYAFEERVQASIRLGACRRSCSSGSARTSRSRCSDSRSCRSGSTTAGSRFWGSGSATWLTARTSARFPRRAGPTSKGSTP